MKIFISLLLSLLITPLPNLMAQTSITCYNIRYANTHDGDFAWEKRSDKVLQKLRLDDSDIVGMQEVLAVQMDFLTAGLTDYSSVGVGRDDGKRGGEFAPIFYKKDKFSCLDSGFRWLSPTADVPSIGWDAACIRLATWIVLENKESKKKLLVINTHYDHVGLTARNNSSAIILSLADSLEKKYSCATVLMGDFNSQASDQALAEIVSTFDNALCSCSGIPENTYIGFPGQKESPAVIDHIFVRGGLKADGYKVDTSNYGLGQLSDHLSVHCIVE